MRFPSSSLECRFQILWGLFWGPLGGMLGPLGGLLAAIWGLLGASWRCLRNVFRDSWGLRGRQNAQEAPKMPLRAPRKPRWKTPAAHLLPSNGAARPPLQRHGRPQAYTQFDLAPAGHPGVVLGPPNGRQEARKRPQEGPKYRENGGQEGPKKVFERRDSKSSKMTIFLKKTIDFEGSRGTIIGKFRARDGFERKKSRSRSEEVVAKGLGMAFGTEKWAEDGREHRSVGQDFPKS